MVENRKKILIIDDESDIRGTLKLLLEGSFEVETAEDGEVGLTLCERSTPDVVLLDVLMPKLDGIETLKRIREKNSTVSVIMLTGMNTVKTAVDAMKYGATDYLNKPFDIKELTAVITSALDLKDEPQPQKLDKKIIVDNSAGDFGALVGTSLPMQKVFETVKQVAPKDATVLITGDSGTGKELIAKRLHELSNRRDKPFIAIHCAAIPESLIESELFGHEKGSFTNAMETRIGQLEAANGGTIFLDEIGEISLPVQVKLLRFLQEHEVQRVGRSKPISVDVRIIAATNRNLESMIEEKKFRQDLYYRINVIGIHLPPLRDRYEDIAQLLNHFVNKFSPQYEGRKITFAQDAYDALISYNWPGNVRELENLVENLMALTTGDVVTEEMLPFKITAPANQGEGGHRTSIFEGSLSFDQAEKIFESEMIIKALKKTNYVQTRAAELLGISRRILKYKMDKLGITDTP